MTTEEAIRILDPETSLDTIWRYDYYGGLSGLEACIAACEEACRVACAALRAQLMQPNDPLTLEELREMAWSQRPVWCSDIDGIHAGLLCIQDDFYVPERTPHIWLLDEEGNSGVYSVESLLKAGASFYRRKPEK